MTELSAARPVGRILHVGAANDAAASVRERLRGVPGARLVSQLGLGFSAEIPPETVQQTKTSDGTILLLAAQWQDFQATVQQQLANRFFTDALLDADADLVIIDSLSGASMDMVRVAALLGYPVVVRLPATGLPAPKSRAWYWLNDALTLAAALYSSGEEGADARFKVCFPGHVVQIQPTLASALEQAQVTGPAQAGLGLNYASYAFGMRDHGLLERMQQAYVSHFAGCRNVLEIASGTGVFLNLLQQHGISAHGVERDRASVRYARGLGLEVIEADALDYLARHRGEFDGLYCSHFVEHLDRAQLERLLELIAAALQPGGIAVFTFPDPESIRSQLLGFWRDPEHVRFYHPDLIELICRGHGLVTAYHSHRAQPRQITSFSLEPPLDAAPLAWPPLPLGEESDADEEAAGWWERLTRRFGLLSPRALARSEARWQRQLAAERAGTAALAARLAEQEAAIRKLWTVNQTWAWDDNALLCMRRPQRG